MADTPSMPPQVNIAYQDAVDNLVFLKSQQWSITNYVLLAEAAIFLIARYPGLSTEGVDRFFLKVLAVIVGFLGIAVLWQMQASMEKFRDRLANIYKRYFNNDELIDFRLEAAPDNSIRSVFIVIVLTVICVLAMVVVLKYM
jgi:hypothetical protein